MKKLIAIALAAMLAPAWAAEVVSSNIVGYNKITLVSGYNMVGPQFVNVGGDALSLASVGELSSNYEGFDDEGEYTVKLLAWSAARQGYTTYGWSGTSPQDFGLVNDDSMNNKWLDGNYEDKGEEIDPEVGFWVQTDAAGTFTVSGEVPSEDTVTVSLVSGFNLVANPYPANVSIADFGALSSNFEGFDEEGEYTVKLLTWSAARQGYTTYGWSGTSPQDFGLVNDDSMNNKWLDGNYEDKGGTVDAGQAVWIQTDRAGSITFTNPVKSND